MADTWTYVEPVMNNCFRKRKRSWKVQNPVRCEKRTTDGKVCRRNSVSCSGTTKPERCSKHVRHGPHESQVPCLSKSRIRCQVNECKNEASYGNFIPDKGKSCCLPHLWEDARLPIPDPKLFDCSPDIGTNICHFRYSKHIEWIRKSFGSDRDDIYPFPFPICKETGCGRTNMTNTGQCRLHVKSSEYSVMIGLFQCPFCDNFNSRERGLGCDLCYRTFMNGSNLIPTRERLVLASLKTDSRSELGKFVSEPTVRSDYLIGPDGYGETRYPDILYETRTHIVIVEVDEKEHQGYDADEELFRMTWIAEILGQKTVFLRFNPDVTSGETSQLFYRIEILKTRILWHLSHIPTEKILYEYLFYSNEDIVDDFIEMDAVRTSNLIAREIELWTVMKSRIQDPDDEFFSVTDNSSTLVRRTSACYRKLNRPLISLSRNGVETRSSMALVIESCQAFTDLCQSGISSIGSEDNNTLEKQMFRNLQVKKKVRRRRYRDANAIEQSKTERNSERSFREFPAVSDWLQSQNIQYEFRKRLPTFRTEQPDSNGMTVTFFIPVSENPEVTTYDCLILCDGIHHFDATVYPDGFDIQVRRDRMLMEHAVSGLYEDKTGFMIDRPMYHVLRLGYHLWEMNENRDVLNQVLKTFFETTMDSEEPVIMTEPSQDYENADIWP